jgi:selT/selW/selH-like putative selenoprotein
LAADIEKSVGLQTTLERGASGVFEVLVDGEPIFSKRKSGRFPLPGEVEGLLKARLGA